MWKTTTCTWTLVQFTLDQEDGDLEIEFQMEMEMKMNQDVYKELNK